MTRWWSPRAKPSGSGLGRLIGGARRFRWRAKYLRPKVLLMTTSGSPAPEGANPAEVVAAGVARTLELARTWLAWDGVPVPAEDRIYTPNKALRRYADHLVDHLAEIEALLAGVPTEPDHWHASAVPAGSDP